MFNDEQFPHSISANEWAVRIQSYHTSLFIEYPGVNGMCSVQYLFGKIKYFPDPKLTFQSPPIAAYNNISNNPQQATNVSQQSCVI